MNFINKNEIDIYVDMDGVVADLYSVPDFLQRMEISGAVFAQLKPFFENVQAVINLVQNGYNVRILSASPHSNGDKAKRAWLNRYLPCIQQNNIIIIRVGENKGDYIQNPKMVNVLFDDYGKNCREWEQKGGYACKIEINKGIATYI